MCAFVFEEWWTAYLITKAKLCEQNSKFVSMKILRMPKPLSTSITLLKDFHFFHHIHSIKKAKTSTSSCALPAQQSLNEKIFICIVSSKKWESANESIFIESNAIQSELLWRYFDRSLFRLEGFDLVFSIHFFFVFVLCMWIEFIAEIVVLATFDTKELPWSLSLELKMNEKELQAKCFYSYLSASSSRGNRKSSQFWVIWKIVVLFACRQLRQAVQILYAVINCCFSQC